MNTEVDNIAEKPAEDKLFYLEVKSPDGDQHIVEINYINDDLKETDKNKEYFSIGRDLNNDLYLPSPDRRISREHCRIETIKGHCFLFDDNTGVDKQPSKSGTFVVPDKSPSKIIDVRKQDQTRLNDGDKILILGKLVPTDNDENEFKPAFWELTFRDNNITLKSSIIPDFYDSHKKVVYSLSLKSLVVLIGNQNQE